MTNVVEFPRRAGSAGAAAVPTGRSVVGLPGVYWQAGEALSRAGNVLMEILEEFDDISCIKAQKLIAKAVVDLGQSRLDCVTRANIANCVMPDAAASALRTYHRNLLLLHPDDDNYDENLRALAVEMLGCDQLHMLRSWCDSHPDDIPLVREFFAPRT